MRNNSLSFELITLGIALFFGLAIWVGASYMEARTYNKLTGNNVTTVDAMFTSLRVADTPQQGD